jgi:hypothetical protein
LLLGTRSPCRPDYWQRVLPSRQSKSAAELRRSAWWIGSRTQSCLRSAPAWRSHGGRSTSPIPDGPPARQRHAHLGDLRRPAPSASHPIRRSSSPPISDVLLGRAVGFGKVALMLILFYQCGIDIGAQFAGGQDRNASSRGGKRHVSTLACVVCCGGRSRRPTSH